MNILIRSETVIDFYSIAQVNDIAFGGKSESELISKLRNTQNFITEFSIIAEIDENIIGHILFYPINIETKTGLIPTVALAPMSVLPKYQNKGVGTKLVQYGLQKCKERGFESVTVLGHANYYPKFGFEPASKWGIYSDFDVADEVFMSMELKEDALVKVAGKVIYPKEYLEA
jgi:putative acetyltransferase